MVMYICQRRYNLNVEVEDVVFDNIDQMINHWLITSNWTCSSLEYLYSSLAPMRSTSKKVKLSVLSSNGQVQSKKTSLSQIRLARIAHENEKALERKQEGELLVVLLWLILPISSKLEVFTVLHWFLPESAEFREFREFRGMNFGWGASQNQNSIPAEFRWF